MSAISLTTAVQQVDNQEGITNAKKREYIRISIAYRIREVFFK
ncbi:hypothetical protein [Ectobacillus funiculus]|nr:hypothetical protein [Ectobacillus funiculus]